MNEFGSKDLYTENREELMRLENSAKEEEKNIEDYYCRIGKMYVSLYADNGTYDSDFACLIEAVRKAKENIAAIRARQLDLKGMMKCSKCGAEIPLYSSFCNICGCPVNKIGEDIETAADEAREAQSLEAFAYEDINMPSEAEEESVEECIEEEAVEVIDNLVTEDNTDTDTDIDADTDTDADADVPDGTEEEDTFAADTENAVIICSECGKELASDSLFCDGCGAAVRNNTDTPAEALEPAPMTEVKNEEPEVKRCRACGTVLEDDAMFCTECGQPINRPLEANSEDNAAKEGVLPAYAPVNDQVTALLTEEPVIPKAFARCVECGAVLEENSAFCTECGKPVFDDIVKADDGAEPEMEEQSEIPAVETAFKDSVTVHEKEVKKCSKCGKAVEDGSVFCANCGQPLEADDSVVERKNGVAGTFGAFAVVKPSAAAVKKCGNCGTILDDDCVFCTECGRLVADNNE